MAKVVVFDVGNVLVRWDPRNLYHKIFADPRAMEHFLDTVCTTDWNLRADMGEDWAGLTQELVARHPKYEAEIRAYRARWSEMIAGPIQDNVALLERFKARGAPVYAITNFAADTFAESQGRFSFLKLFDGVVCSGQEGVVKPDARIYRLLLDRYGLNAQDCVFIDDSAKNIVAAGALGFRTIHYNLGLDAKLAFAQLGLPVE